MADIKFKKKEKFLKNILVGNTAVFKCVNTYFKFHIKSIFSNN